LQHHRRRSLRDLSRHGHKGGKAQGGCKRHRAEGGEARPYHQHRPRKSDGRSKYPAPTDGFFEGKRAGHDQDEGPDEEGRGGLGKRYLAGGGEEGAGCAEDQTGPGQMRRGLAWVGPGGLPADLPDELAYRQQVIRTCWPKRAATFWLTGSLAGARLAKLPLSGAVTVKPVVRRMPGRIRSTLWLMRPIRAQRRPGVQRF